MQPWRVRQLAGLGAALAAGMLLSEHLACGQVPCKYDVRIVSADFCSVGTSPILPRGINNQDPPTVVGSYRVCAPSDDRPFYWISDQQSITPMIEPPETHNAVCRDISDFTGDFGVGQVVGYLTRTNIGHRGFIWEDATWTIIDPLPGDTVCNIWAISDSTSLLVGTSSGSIKGGSRVFTWQSSSAMEVRLPYGTNHTAYDISPDGSLLAGRMTKSVQHMRAFIWENGRVTDPGWLPDSTMTSFQAVNDFSEAVGFVTIPDPSRQCESLGLAAYWKNDKFTIIGTLPPRLQSIALDISNTGIVIGIAITYATCNGCYCQIPFVWSADTGIQALQSLIDSPPEKLYLGFAEAINDRGEILCEGGIPGYGNVAVVLTPIPRKGDVNCDGRVDLYDLVDVVQSWGACRGCRADLTEDWNVNVDDLLEVINHWNP